MLSMALMYYRHVAGPVLITAVAAASLATGITLAKVRRHAAHAHTRPCPAQRQIANLAGELSVLRDDVECRLMAAALLANPDDPRWETSPPREN